MSILVFLIMPVAAGCGLQRTRTGLQPEKREPTAALLRALAGPAGARVPTDALIGDLRNGSPAVDVAWDL